MKVNSGGSQSDGILSAMSQPSFYLHRPGQVETRQTHISHVFLAEEYVYKIKKPVRFPFLDYSTLANRLHFCEEEVRLNKRLAANTYLKVVPIFARGDGWELGEGLQRSQGRVMEYAVKMRRLPEAAMMDHLVQRGGIDRDTIAAIVRKLALFHRNATTRQATLYGAWQAIKQQTAENLTEIGRHVGQTIHSRTLRELTHYNKTFLSDQKELFEKRLREDKVREGHGDLRAEHVCLTDGITIFDCIEFSEAFRYCDVASEIAFLTMDLDFLDASELADMLRENYALATEDRDLRRILSFYECYRACVRGKVQTLQSLGQEAPQDERHKAAAHARRYFRLSLRYAVPLNQPALIVVCGKIASGKSTLAKALKDMSGFRLKSSEIVRKGLVGVSPRQRMSSAYGQGIYSASFDDKVHSALLDEARTAFRRGRGLIIDASFKEEKRRTQFREEAEKDNVPVVFVECRSSESEIFHRLQARGEKHDEASDATWQTYLRQRKDFVPFSDSSVASHLVFDGSTEPEDLFFRLRSLFAGRAPH